MLRSASLAAISFLAVLVAACGSGGGSADADPATAVPANAPFYVEVTVRPEGALREDVLAAAGKVLRTDDPATKITEFFEKEFSDTGSPFDYESDAKPWLGERIGVWAEAEGDSAAIVAAASDTDKALEAIEASGRREGEKLTERSYRDADYFVDEDGFAAGVVDDFAIAGDEALLKRTVDAIEGDSLADSDRYRGAVDGLPDERLSQFYVDLKALFDLAAKEDPSSAEALRQLRGLIPFDRLPPASGVLLANGERIALDAGVRLGRDDSLRKLGAFAGAASTPLVRELPGDSWGAYAVGDVGESWRAALDAFGGALGGQMLQQQAQRQFGLDIEQDLLSWIGDLALFVRGTTPDAIDGGAVIEVTDEDRAAAAFGKIVGALRTRARVPARPVQIEGAETAFAIGFRAAPKPLVLARGEGKVVVAYGTDAATEALSPSQAFGETDAYAQAKEVLGGDLEPGMLLSIPAIVSLVDASGNADAEFEEARPYLEAFTTFAIGGGMDGDRAHTVIAAGLK